MGRMDVGGGEEIWLVGRELKHFTTLWLRKCEPSTGGSHFENEKREETRKVAINPSDLFSSPLANLPSNNPRLFLSFFLSYTQTISSQPMHGRGMSGSSRLYYKSVIKNESSSSSLNVRNQLTTTKMSTLLLAAAIFSILLLFLFGSF